MFAQIEPLQWQVLQERRIVGCLQAEPVRCSLVKAAGVRLDPIASRHQPRLVGRQLGLRIGNHRQIAGRKFHQNLWPVLGVGVEK